MGRLKDSQGTLSAGAGFLQFAQIPLDDTQVAKRLGDRRVLGTVGCRESSQGTFGVGAGVP